MIELRCGDDVFSRFDTMHECATQKKATFTHTTVQVRRAAKKIKQKSNLQVWEMSNVDAVCQCTLNGCTTFTDTAEHLTTHVTVLR